MPEPCVSSDEGESLPGVVKDRSAGGSRPRACPLTGWVGRLRKFKLSEWVHAGCDDALDAKREK